MNKPHDWTEKLIVCKKNTSIKTNRIIYQIYYFTIILLLYFNISVFLHLCMCAFFAPQNMISLDIGLKHDPVAFSSTFHEVHLLVYF